VEGPRPKRNCRETPCQLAPIHIRKEVVPEWFDVRQGHHHLSGTRVSNLYAIIAAKRKCLGSWAQLTLRARRISKPPILDDGASVKPRRSKEWSGSRGFHRQEHASKDNEAQLTMLQNTMYSGNISNETLHCSTSQLAGSAAAVRTNAGQ